MRFTASQVHGEWRTVWEDLAANHVNIPTAPREVGLVLKKVAVAAVKFSLQQLGSSSSPDWQVSWRETEQTAMSPLMSDRGECVSCVFNSPFSCQCAAALHVPRVCCDGVERETLGDLHRRHGTFHILFVGQNENGRLLKVLHSPRKHTRDAFCTFDAKGKQKNPQKSVYVTGPHSQWNI